jgi:hypothetical protein
LEALDISYCELLSKGVGSALKDNCKNLKALKATSVINAFDDDELEYIAGIDTLNDIDFSLCSLITDEGLIKFAYIKTPHTMTKINFSALFRLTNAGLIKILSTQNGSLTHVVLSMLAQVLILFYC